MNFSTFLKERRSRLKLRSSKEHYEELGGKAQLGIELRQFQQIESGKYPPSEKVLVGLFQKTPSSQRHTLFRSYFRSVLLGMKGAKILNDFLETSLSPGIDSEEAGVWEAGNQERPRRIYTEEQLNYLIENPDAMRLHKKLTLYEVWEESDAQIPSKKVDDLEGMDLLRRENGKLYPSNTLYRLPNYENSGPGPVSRAYKYIQTQVNLYASREGADNQELGYGMQLVTPEVAKTIVEQMNAFKRWVQSNASSKTDDSVVPLIFVGFTKWLEPREL